MVNRKPSRQIASGAIIGLCFGGTFALVFIPIVAVPIGISMLIALAIRKHESRKRIASLMLICLLWGVSNGCYDAHAQESRVVRFLEANGSGNISTFSQPGLAQWLSEHREVAQQAEKMCEPLYAHSPANWAPSAEGTVCLCARSFAPPPNFQSDNQKW